MYAKGTTTVFPLQPKWMPSSSEREIYRRLPLGSARGRGMRKGGIVFRAQRYPSATHPEWLKRKILAPIQCLSPGMELGIWRPCDPEGSTHLLRLLVIFSSHHNKRHQSPQGPRHWGIGGETPWIHLWTVTCCRFSKIALGAYYVVQESRKETLVDRDQEEIPGEYSLLL